MIEKIFSGSRNAEVNDTAQRMIKSHSSSGLSSDAPLSGIITKVRDYVQRLTTAINRSKMESTLDEKDMKRDDQLRALFYLIMGLLYHPDVAIATAAAAIKTILDKYSLSIATENYGVESTMINSLLQDLSAENLQPSIEALSGCAERITALQTAQTEFEETRNLLDQAEGESENTDSATEIKKELVSTINNQLIGYLGAMQEYDPQTYANFAATIDSIIAAHNETVKKRRSKGEPDEGDEENGTPTTTE